MEFFVVGGVIFWVLVVIELVLLTACIEHEQGFGATISLGVFLLVLHLGSDVDVLKFAGTHALELLIGAIAYFAMGAGWSVIKWWIYCRDRLELYHERRDRWLKDNKLPVGNVPPEHRVAFTKFLAEYRGYQQETWLTMSRPPSVSENKARILRWMSFWVVSMIWTFLDDFVKRIFRSIYQSIAAYLQSIANRAFESASQDIEPPVIK